MTKPSAETAELLEMMSRARRLIEELSGIVFEVQQRVIESAVDAEPETAEEA